MTTLLDRLPRQRVAVNEAAVRAVVAMIELYPERWNQASYAGWRYRPDGGKIRTFCFAGWTVHLAGEQPLHLLQQTTPPDAKALTARAAGLLGLSPTIADALFNWGDPFEDDEPHPTVADLKAFLTDLLGLEFRSNSQATP